MKANSPGLHMGLGLLAVLGLIWWLQQEPSAIASWQKARIEAQQITVNDVVYQAEWGEPVTHQGYVQQIVSDYRPYFPVITHDLVLTTGDYSDAEKVKIRPLKEGKTVWRAKTSPQGTLVVLHVMPNDEDVLKAFQALNAGAEVKITGREELDANVSNSQGGYYRMNGNNHILIRVDQLERL